MLKALIVDDEDKARENLAAIIKEYCENIEVAGMSGTVEDALSMIKKVDPQLVFLDIKMNNETGFDLIERIDEMTFDVIFITAYDQYAIKAFKCCAIDYLLKPISIDELQDAIQKVEDKMDSNQSKLNYQILKEHLHTGSSRPKKIGIPTSEGLIFVKIEDIIRCEADGSYTHIFLKGNEKITVSKILKEYDELLSDYHFQRIHQSHLINLDLIKKYINAKGGQVVMLDDSIVGVSRNYKEKLVKRLAEI